MEKQTALQLLFETGLRHLYQAERAIADNLKTLEEKAASTELKGVFRGHYTETERQIHRLEQVFNILDIDIRASKLQGLPRIADQAKELLKTLADMNFTDRSKGIDGILNEGKELLRHFANTDANEFALVSASQKVEHFEIACYSSLCLLAVKFGNKEVADLLRESLDEEIRMEKRILEYARSHLQTPELSQK